MNDPLPPLGGLHEAALYVDDLDHAEAFWRRLGFPFVGRAEGRHVFFRVGQDLLLLFKPQATLSAGDGAPAHGAIGPGHVAFDVPDEAALEAWRKRLEGAAVDIETELEWPNGGRSLYFRDSDGNSVELITRGTWGF